MVGNQDLELLAAAQEGAKWLRTPGAPDARQALPYCATSNMADAWLIGAWSVYWTGSAPRVVHPSRGHSMRIEGIGYRDFVKVTDPYDHRKGVEVLPRN